VKILVVDDDRDLRGILVYAFVQAGFLVVEASDGEEALVQFEAESPDLVVLDVNLPRLDGFAVCRRIRASSKVPILMLTVRGDEGDVVRGLDLGADDYLTKPFSPRTLLARVRALSRRAGMDVPATETVGRLTLDPESRTLVIAGRDAVRLTKLEHRLVQMLLARAGRPVPSERLWSHVWGAWGGGDRQLLKQLVHRLRQKIEDDPARPRYLRTEAGLGYRLDAAGGENDAPGASDHDRDGAGDPGES
jgi:DNA-binding response OmpR family regulator